MNCSSQSNRNNHNDRDWLGSTVKVYKLQSNDDNRKKFKG